MIVSFPSSLITEQRLMTGAEISAMANRSDPTGSGVVQGLLRSTYVRTVEPGPYAWPGAPQWEQALAGDLIYGLLTAAVVNVPRGNEYKFQVQCTGRRHPRGKSKQYEWAIDLVSDLLAEPVPSTDDDAPPPKPSAVKRLSPATVKHLLDNGNRFETTCAGRKVVYKLQSPSDEPHAAALRAVAKEFTHAEQLAVQCVEIEGIKPGVSARWAHFLSVDAPDLYRLFEEVQANDCGIETGVWTACPECGWEQKTDVPFDDLFSPRRP